ncbi:MAG: DUF5020 family protein [Bacteroidales bacterium]|nr:DUF5020 family protein [Bacteroidales bacterium]
MFKKLFVAAFALLAMATAANAQTNFQTFYDFGRGHFTTTMEGFHMDNWGNTFFFIDYDYNLKDLSDGTILSPGNTYFEIARCLNFWQDSKLAPFSWQLEYNGGFGHYVLNPPIDPYAAFPVNSAFLTGVDYFMHSKDFKNTLNLKLLYKYFVKLPSKVPLQFTAVWGCQDLFGAPGLRFSGFIDFWCEYDNLVILSEPQIWYQLFDHFNIGSEVEFSYNFAGMQGFNIMPCLGTKWVF